jgi:hypothetical protein
MNEEQAFSLYRTAKRNLQSLIDEGYRDKEEILTDLDNELEEF